jgi:hypothetical protein
MPKRVFDSACERRNFGEGRRTRKTWLRGDLSSKTYRLTATGHEYVRNLPDASKGEEAPGNVSTPGAKVNVASEAGRAQFEPVEAIPLGYSQNGCIPRLPGWAALATKMKPQPAKTPAAIQRSLPELAPFRHPRLRRDRKEPGLTIGIKTSRGPALKAVNLGRLRTAPRR